MSTLEKLYSYLDEMKQGLVTCEDIFHSEFLTKEEKKFLLEGYKKWLKENNREDEFTFSPDPIDEDQGVLLTWGTTEADKKFSPIEPHFFVILAGEQGSGKTAFSFDLAIKNARGVKCLYISLEMTKDQILTRIARSYAGITKEEWRYRKGIPESKAIAYRRKKGELESIENLITAGFGKGTTPTIEAIFELILKHQPELVFVDNLDLISKAQGVKQIDHEQNVSKAFMNFTNNEKIPVIVIHHLNKSKNKQGIDSVRGSGKITDDADTVMICKRCDCNQGSTPEERAQFTIYEKKDRSFGMGGIHTFYFKSGSFYDEFENYSQAYKQKQDEK